MKTGYGTAYHTHIDIDYALSLAASDFKDIFIVTADGVRLSTSEAREWLKKQREEGKKVIPWGTPCEGFSYETGCPGHPSHEKEMQQ